MATFSSGRARNILLVLASLGLCIVVQFILHSIAHHSTAPFNPATIEDTVSIRQRQENKLSPVANRETVVPPSLKGSYEEDEKSESESERHGALIINPKIISTAYDDQDASADCVSPAVACRKSDTATTPAVAADATPPHRTRTGSSITSLYPRTLALADPVLRGGFRNQVMRFVYLVFHAVSNGYDSILLPSINFASTNVAGGGPEEMPIPFDTFYDADHWNRYAAASVLPILVPHDPALHGDWNPGTRLFRLVDCPLMEKVYAPGPRGKDAIMQRLRRHNVSRPYPYGGGYQLGNLWNGYRDWDKSGKRHVSVELPRNIRFRNRTATTTFDSVETDVLRAMKPGALIRGVVSRVISNTVSGEGGGGNGTTGGHPGVPPGGNQTPPTRPRPYIALHARVEPQMLNHKTCGKMMVRSLERIFDAVSGYNFGSSSDGDDPTTRTIGVVGTDGGGNNVSSSSPLLLFVAIDRVQMDTTEPRHEGDRAIHAANRRTLDRALAVGLEGTSPSHGSDDRGEENRRIKMSVFTGGEGAIRRFTDLIPPCKSGLLGAAVLDWEIAVDAAAFVGTRISSYSHSVWAHRHATGRGSGNYEYRLREGDGDGGDAKGAPREGDAWIEPVNPAGGGHPGQFSC